MHAYVDASHQHALVLTTRALGLVVYIYMCIVFSY